MNAYHGKNVLLFGLGVLGGGVATANWLIDHGARLVITDLKSEHELAPSIEKIRSGAEFHLGGHTNEDMAWADIIVMNPDVSIEDPFIAHARALGKQLENEATIFYDNFPGKIVAVTGTRGKTTTTLWINHFLSTMCRSSIAGNSTTHPYLEMLERADELDWVVTELPSYHLELFPAHRAPDIAVITNLTPDHLNRHGSMERYADTKANMFTGQTAAQHLILNADDPNTDLFLQKKPAARISFFSINPQQPSEISLQDFNRGDHNTANLLAAALAAHTAGCSWHAIQKAIPDLPQVPLRQEVVFESERLTIINDSAATSPEGALAAINRFESPSTIFVFGGTDRQLLFDAWAHAVRSIDPNRLIFLTGSATEKMLAALALKKKPDAYDTLPECVQAALEKARNYPNALIVFSPGAKSFEKFKNEYDRGDQFNKIIQPLSL